MSDGDSPTPAPRRRPSYGRPGPAPTEQPAAGHGYDAAPQGSSDSQLPPPVTALPESVPTSGSSAPGGPGHGAPGYGAPGYGTPGYGAAAPGAGGPPAAGGDGPAPRRRRGLLPLIIGLVLFVLLGPGLAVGGLLWGGGSMMQQVGSAPTPIDAAGEQVELSANTMLILYVPSEDAGAACTATSDDSGALTTVPTSGQVTLPDGSSYEQQLGVVATADTTAVIECSGTDAPAMVGPVDVLGAGLPMIIGIAAGFMVGLIGLVLTIVGIVLLVRSRRRA